MKYILCLSVLLVTVACSRYPSDVEHALKLAGDNRTELEKALEHYRQQPEDSLKYKAACFLIANMPGHFSVEYPDMENYYSQIRSIFAIANIRKSQADSLFQRIEFDPGKMTVSYDIQNMSASCLTDRIDQAFETRNYPWTRSISWSDFCEYVLPYRIEQEPIEDWRPLYKQKIAKLFDSLIKAQASDSLACTMFMAFFKPKTFVLVDHGFPVPLKPSLYMEMIAGSCQNLSHFTQYAMRTAGLPVTYDFTPQWANRSLGHEWNALISNGKAISFQIGDRVPLGQHLSSKSLDRLAKVYRKMFSLQKESLVMQHPKEDIPPLFRNPFMRDVSECYFDPIDIDVDLTIPFSKKKQIAYIMVFNNRDWLPVAWGRIRNHRTTFSKMNIGCAYLAMYYDNGNFYAASNPFYVDKEGKIKILNPRQETESVTILRKYPFRDMRVIKERMPGGKFQLANHPDFKDAVTIHEIDTIQVMSFQHIMFDDLPTFKYFRYLSPNNGHVFMAEMMVYNAEDRKLTGEIIGTEGSWDNNGRDKYKVFDGDCLTYFDAPVRSGGWVGLAFGQKEQIKALYYLPKNDDNHINAGESYELFYYDRGWISLGKRTGDLTHVLVYDHVPENTLLWLRNHTKGREERIFTYENGKQVWW